VDHLRPAAAVDACLLFAVAPGARAVQPVGRGPLATLAAGDAAPPDVTAPVATLRRTASASAGALPMTVSWPAATDAGAGVAAYELEQRVGAQPWTPVALATPLSRSVNVLLPPSLPAQFRLRATDGASNTSDWQAGPVFQARLGGERAAKYTGSWITRTGTSYLGGAERASRTAGSTATFRFTGSQIAWIAPMNRTSGSARVSVDGKVVATVSLRSSTTKAHRLVFTRTWASVGRHTISIRVAGTSGHPWVGVDGFASLDVASFDPVLAGAGDIASCSDAADSATAAVLDQTPGTVFAAGDLAYPSGTATQFRDCYGPTWGWFKSRTKPVPGNHEYKSAGAQPYFAYMGSHAGAAGKGWYAFDVGTWRVYALNANCDQVGCGPGSAQETWLRQDLATHPAACVAAIWHQPLFSSGYHGGSPAVRPLWQDLYDAGADLVISGHDHDYERFAPQRPDGTADPVTGIREFVAGTGGGTPRPFATAQPNSEVRHSGTYGILRLTLLPGSYSWEFVPVAGSTWSDSGSASCH
jgi:hypothetical protein